VGVPGAGPAAEPLMDAARPRRPFPSRPWGLRPQTPAFGLNGLVLKLPHCLKGVG